MNRPHLLLIAALGVLVIAPGSAAAQDRPVVLVHGFASSGDTWIEAGDRLSTQLAATVYHPSTQWINSYEHQAAQLQGQLGSLGPSTVALGHSNGGLVARAWTKWRNLDGLVTLSSPNSGAPMANNFYQWIGINLEGISLVSNVIASFANQSEASGWVYGVVVGSLQASDGFAKEALKSLGRFGLDKAFPVFPQVPVGSPFFQELNGGANLAREAAAVPNRVSIVNSVSDWWSGGVFRAMFPDQAGAINTGIWVAATTLDAWGVTIVATGAPRDVERASAMWSLAAWLRNHERVWCNTISDPTPYAYTAIGACLENDTVIPAWSAQLPQGLTVRKYNTPVHIRQTSAMNAVLYEVLTTQMHVAPRGPGGGAGSPTVLVAGQSLMPGQEVRSPDARYRLVYQPDGNLVLYRNDGAPAWSSGTYGQSAGQAYMQRDGNFVVYDAASRPVWHASTYNHPGAYLIVNNSGTITVADAAGATLWSSPQPPWNVNPTPTAPTGLDTLAPGGRVYPGQAVSSADGRFALTYQTDGNLVLYGPGGVPRWSTQVFSSPAYAEMQVDGNFVVYASNGTPVWASNTSGRLNARLVVHNDGNVVIYTSSGAPIWQTGTGGS
jgi:pimeloyl-ACP methyl ester carboxylesterase